MGCSPSKLDGLHVVALCRLRCNSLEETLHCSYVLSDAHAAYLIFLNTIGPTLHHFFLHAMESSPDFDTETDESAETSSLISSSSVHSVTNSDSYLPAKFDSDGGEEDENCTCTHCDIVRVQKLESLNLIHEPLFYTRSFKSGCRTPPPPPPPSNYTWDFINLFESYEFPYTTNAKDWMDNKETTRIREEYTLKMKMPKSGNQEKIKEDEHIQKLKISEKKTTSGPRESKASLDFSEVTKQWHEMFKKASESGNGVLKMLDTSRYRCYLKSSVYQSSSNILYVKKMMTALDSKPVEDLGSNFNNLSSTLKKIFMWEKKLYQEVKAEEKLRTSHMKNYKLLRRLEQKSADLSKIEATRSSIQCLSTRMKVSIRKIDCICLTINKLRDEELWSQIKELIHRLSEMWSSMLECHSRQVQVMVDAKKLETMTLKKKLDLPQLELAMELKLELRNWNQSLTNWIDAQAQYVKALNRWLRQCLKQEPLEPTPDLSEEPPLFGAINSWSQTFKRSDGGKEFTEAVYMILMCISRQVDKQKMELEAERNANGDIKDMERKLVMLEKEEQEMWRKMRTEPSVELTERLNLKSSFEQIFKSMEKLATNFKQTYQELDLMCT